MHSGRVEPAGIEFPGRLRGQRGHRLPHRGARRQFQYSQVAGLDARALRPAGRRQNALHRKVRQILIQPGPGEAAVHRSPHAEVVGHHNLVGISGRDGHAVHSGTDHRLRTVGGQRIPTLAVIERAEQLAAQAPYLRGIGAQGNEGGGRVGSARRNAIERSRRYWVTGSRVPGFKIQGLEKLAGGGARVEQGAVVGIPDLDHRPGDGRSQL